MPKSPGYSNTTVPASGAGDEVVVTQFDELLVTDDGNKRALDNLSVRSYAASLLNFDEAMKKNDVCA